MFSKMVQLPQKQKKTDLRIQSLCMSRCIGLGRDGIFKNGIFIYVAYYSGLHLIFQLNVV